MGVSVGGCVAVGKYVHKHRIRQAFLNPFGNNETVTSPPPHHHLCILVIHRQENQNLLVHGSRHIRKPTRVQTMVEQDRSGQNGEEMGQGGQNGPRTWQVG